jgi:thiol-disulfide isomerase/thioredoxin
MAFGIIKGVANSGSRGFSVAVAAAILLVAAAALAAAPTNRPFLTTLANLGATPEEIRKYSELYAEMPPEGKALYDKNDSTRLKADLEYHRALWGGEAAHPLLKIGAALPAFALKGVDGKMYRAENFKNAQFLVVAFMSNHCPASQMVEGRFKQLVAAYSSRGVAFVAIQPDGAMASAPSELGFTDVEDDFAGMQERARFRHFTFPYLDDGEQQNAVKAFGPKSTPHLFIFDRERKLRYEGRIDNNLRADKATTHEARDAIEALLAGKPVAVEHTPTFGCSIKWNDRAELAAQERQQWQALPVKVATASAAQLTALRKKPPGKTVIINLWATWCGPCKIELPEIVKTYQWYRGREVDLVTISVDDPANRAGVQKFLQTVHAPVTNLQVDTSDLFAVQAAFDPEWQSGVPYTLVLGPEGHMIYREEGQVDILKMRRAILASLNEPGPFAGNADYWNNHSQ